MTETVAERIRSFRQVRPELPAPAERKAVREAAGLTLAQVGSAVGVTAQAVGLWESGRRTPRGTLLDRYAEAISAMRELA
ncbi:helix-turn-helix transcriptional regulator [Streptomyces sp. NBC_00620]|uniref:helix-turn-helix domain-containing protein n=1 Tax=Streptomyces sp. NBC_00620 TaxID=2903666 RepID=UPI00225ABBBD|nr:helix-turn-helix transcriptional regulator [Streptomyces sp. NBC_00620]MCX4973143.1 helix-turn-helix domain-containing protein [Streptomyces sp. NBC_00620]